MTSRRSAFELALVAVLGLYLAGCLFASPIADDFVYASNVRGGFWNAWVREYLGWNGRYASNALVLGTPLLFGVAAYRVAAAMIISSTAAAVYVFVRASAADALTRREALTCSLTFCAVYLSQMPSLGEGVYWYTSAATYQLWVVPALVQLGLVIRYSRLDHHTLWDRLTLALAAVLLIAAAGFNEVVMLMMLSVYGVWLGWNLRHGSPDRMRVAGFFAIAGVCALVVLLSPGNVVRQSMYPGVRHQLMRSTGLTVLQTLRFCADWGSNGALLIATVLFVPIAEKWLRRWPRDPGRARQAFAILIAGMTLVVPLATFPAYWETGLLGQHRTINVAYFAFLVLWFAAVLMWLASGSRHVVVVQSFSREWRRPLGIVLLAALALTRNSYALGADLVSGRLAGFDRQMRDRFAQLQSCHARGERSCQIDPLLNKPGSFFVLDVSQNPHHWVNAAYARYFDVAAVRSRPSGVDDDVRH